MSDRDIRNLYEGIQRGESHDSPVREKDLYEQVLREATITISYDDKSIPKQTFKMSDDVARSLGTHENKLKLPRLIEQWAKSGGWNSATALKAVPAGIVSHLSDMYDLNNPEVVDQIISEIEQLTSIKQQGGLNILISAIAAKSFNVIDTIANAHENIPMLSNQEFLKRLMSLSDFTENNVSVGNGEVLITLYTEAVNPEKGDLMLPTGEEVELKGAAGRPGKGDVVDRAVKFERHTIKNFKDFDENRKQNEVFQIKEPLKRDIKAIYPYYSDSTNSAAKKAHDKLVILYNRLTESDCCDYDEILKLIKNVITQLTNRTTAYNKEVLDAIDADNKTGYLDDIIAKFGHMKNTINQRTKTPEGGAGYISSYLSKYGFGKFKTDLNMQSELAGDLSKMSSEPGLAKKAAMQIINNCVNDGTLDREHITTVALRVLSAIQIVDYEKTEGFEYYIAMCEKEGDVYGNAYAIGPFDNYMQSIQQAFDVLMQTNATISANTGGKAGQSGRGGYNIKLNQ